jgi:hypothetical protein
MKYKSLFLSLVLMLLLGAFQQIFACSCVRGFSTCRRYNSSGAIFIGKAVEIKTLDTGNNLQEEFTIFEVEETFLGAKKAQISVRNKSGTSCDTQFQKGETYVVFADGDAKRGFDTSMCAGNTLIADADEILDDLRSLPKAGAGGKIYGQVSESFKRRVDAESVPMAGVKIKFQEVGGKRKIYNVVTDDEGNYELIVPEGKYEIIPTVPPYAELGYLSEEPISVKDRGCTDESFSFVNKSQISGRIIDSDGKPVTSVEVELVSADSTEKPDPYDNEGYASVEDDGTFFIKNIPGGRYTLSVNYLTSPDEESPFPTVFYPNAPERAGAKIFEIGLGKSIGGIVFRLPPRLVEKTIRGTIFFEDEKPAANIDIYLEDAENPGFCLNGCDSRTDAEGNFALKGFMTRTYRVKASTEAEKEGEKKKYSLESAPISLYDNVNELKLVLKDMDKEK